MNYLEIYLSADVLDFQTIIEQGKIEKYGANRNHDDRISYYEYIKVTRDISLAMLLNVARLNGVDEEFVFQATDLLIDDRELSLLTMPYFVRYRLTECCYALEYPDAPLGFYQELISLGVISGGKYKYSEGQYTKEPGSDVSLQFIRAGLIFEFKMQQRMQSIMLSRKKYDSIIFPSPNPESSRTERKNIAAHYKKMIDFWFLQEDKNSIGVFQCKGHVLKINVENLFKQMNAFYLHKRMFGGTQGSWLGTLGAFYIEKCKEEELGKTIYSAESKKTTISEEIESKFTAFGFTMSARSLYLRYKSMKKDDYSKVRCYISLLFEKGVLMFPWYFNNNDYYDLVLGYEERNKRGAVY